MPISKVLLIKPAYKDSYYTMDDMPAGLGYISHALDMNSIENSVFDMCMDGGFGGLCQAIKKRDPQLIGLSLMSYRFLDHYALMDNIKERFPHILIVVGGPHLSLYREDVLRRCSAVDFGVVLEGDETIVELCNNIDNPSPENIVVFKLPTIEISYFVSVLEHKNKPLSNLIDSTSSSKTLSLFLSSLLSNLIDLFFQT